MTAIERFMAAQFKIETVLGQMLSVGFMAFSAAQDRETRMRAWKEKIKKYQDLFNLMQNTCREAGMCVEMAAMVIGEDVDLPEPWESVQNAPEEEVLAILEDMWRQANEEAGLEGERE